MTFSSRHVATLRRATRSATFSYMVALAMGGAAVVLSVFLPPSERGDLVATTTGATIGVAVGGLSLETFLLAQGRAWLERTAGRQSFAVYASTVPLSAVLAWLFTSYSAAGSPWLSAIGAAVLSAGTLPAAAGLSGGGFIPVYRSRAVFATAVPVLYLVLALLSVRTSDAWLACWLVSQGVLALMMWLRFGGVLIRSLRSSYGFPWNSVSRIVFTHIGAVALIPALRFDQLALARYGGASELALYSLAIAASEFAQAGSVIAAQRVLGDHGDSSASGLRKSLRDSLLFALAMSVLILAGLYVIGLVANDYRPALLLGALLIPRSLFIVVGKVLSARQVNLNGEGTAAAIACGTSVVAVAAFLLIVPHYGAVGAALMTGAAFAVRAVVTAITLRRRSDPMSHRSPAERGAPELV